MKSNRPGPQRLPEDDPFFAGLVTDLKILHRVSPPDERQWRAAPAPMRVIPRRETEVIHASRGQVAPTGAERRRKVWLPLSAATIILALGGLVNGLGTLAGRQVPPLRPAIGARDDASVGLSGAPNAARTAWESGWPMVGHDPQQTRRSPGLGPLSPHLLWTYRGMVSPVVIGADGTVYGWTAHSLTALTAAGKQRWTVAAREDFGGPPALGSDGLLRGSGDLNGTSGARSVFRPIVALFAISPQGKRAWTIRSLPWATVPNSVPFSKFASPIVTAANLFYVPFVGPSYTSTQNNGVEMVGAGGVPIRRLLAGFGGPIAVALDGTVYQLGYNYAGQTALLASRPDGTVLWRRPVTYEQPGSVVVGRQGTVYVSDGAGGGPHDAAEVAAYTPAGRLLWRREANAGAATLAERQDGSVLIADARGLAAFSPSGAPLWRTPLGPSPVGAAAPSLAVDSAGDAYIGSADGEVRAVSPRGILLWTVRAGDPSRWAVPSVTLGPNGILTVVGTDGTLRLFH